MVDGIILYSHFVCSLNHCKISVWVFSQFLTKHLWNSQSHGYGSCSQNTGKKSLSRVENSNLYGRVFNMRTKDSFTSEWQLLCFEKTGIEVVHNIIQNVYHTFSYKCSHPINISCQSGLSCVYKFIYHIKHGAGV